MIASSWILDDVHWLSPTAKKAEPKTCAGVFVKKKWLTRSQECWAYISNCVGCSMVNVTLIDGLKLRRPLWPDWIDWSGDPSEQSPPKKFMLLGNWCLWSMWCCDNLGWHKIPSFHGYRLFMHTLCSEWASAKNSWNQPFLLANSYSQCHDHSRR